MQAWGRWQENWPLPQGVGSAGVGAAVCGRELLEAETKGKKVVQQGALTITNKVSNEKSYSLTWNNTTMQGLSGQTVLLL